MRAQSRENAEILAKRRRQASVEVGEGEFGEMEQDACPKCPDKEKRKLAIMMAKRHNGNAQDYYDALANPDFINDRVSENITWLGNISLLFGGASIVQWFRGLFTKGGVKIVFGQTANQIYHTFRHIEAAGLSKTAVQKAVQKSLKQVASKIKPGKPFNKIVTVGGKKIQYTAYKLPSGTINVGRIHLVK